MVSSYATSLRFSYKKQSYALDNLNMGVHGKNVQKLLARKKGTRFHVVNGELETIRGVKATLHFWRHKKEEITTLSSTIDAALQELQSALAQHEDQEKADAAVRALFDPHSRQGMGRLTKALYSQEKFLHGDSYLARHALAPHTYRLKIGKCHFVDATSKEFDVTPETCVVKLGIDSKTAAHNLTMLMNRKKGERFEVSKGKLHSIKSSWSYRRHQHEKEKRVKVTITKALKTLNATLPTKVDTRVSAILRHRFLQDGPLARMSKEVFARKEIAAGSILEKHLTTDLATPREILFTSYQHWQGVTEGHKSYEKVKMQVEKALLDYHVAECRFAQSLGLELKPLPGGSGGARCGFDRNERPLLVIKPADEGPSGINNPKWYAKIKRLFISPKGCLLENPEPLVEYESWLYDRMFGAWVVPPTDMREMESRAFVKTTQKLCSIQMFVHGGKKLSTYLEDVPFLAHTFAWRKRLRKVLASKENWLPHEAMHRFGLHNFLEEDIDCHLENALVKEIDEPLEKNLFTREDITHLFENKDQDRLLDHFLFSALCKGKPSEEKCVEKEEAEGKEEEDPKLNKRIAVVKIDNGAALPRHHPNDRLSYKYKHLFEVLPHFSVDRHTDKGKEPWVGKEKVFAQFLFLKASLDLQHIDPKIFKTFWKDEKNKKHLQRWVFCEEEEEVKRRAYLFAALFKASKQGKERENKLRTYFDQHLARIRGGLQTRMDSYRVMQIYLQKEAFSQKPLPPLREMYLLRTDKDFRKVLAEAKDGFVKTRHHWQKMKKIDIHAWI